MIKYIKRIETIKSTLVELDKYILTRENALYIRA